MQKAEKSKKAGFFEGMSKFEFDRVGVTPFLVNVSIAVQSTPTRSTRGLGIFLKKPAFCLNRIFQ